MMVRSTPELGRLIRRAREAKGLTRDELARQLRITVTYPGYLERGQRCPRPALLARIADAIGADYTDLARAAGYAPQSIGEYTVTVADLEQAAWLRQLGARFDAAELERLYQFGVDWLPSVTERAERAERRDVRARAG